MCGIAGQVRADGAPVSPELIEEICAAQEHRGPDSRGLHVEGPVGLGIQRLRIIDVAGGDQPVYNEDGTVAVVLNGEIYNYAELRRELRGRGHRLETAGDTEVIAHLYEDHGAGLVHRLHGMFAFALWDARRGRLLIGRDRLGKKPLFYSARDGALSFASELRALLRDPGVDRALDPAAIDAYLAYGYVPAPASAFRGVRKLPPAHTLSYEGGEVATQRYWRPRYDKKLEFGRPEELHERIRSTLDAAVRRRLVGEVPLGLFLSGGIDSAAVLASMAAQSSQPVKTFSVGFADERVDELPRARLLAERFSTDHHELIVEPDAIGLLPEIVAHYGEPFGDHSALPCFHLAEFARGEVTVALNGDGGDECFGGYQRYSANLLAARLEALPAGLRQAIAEGSRRLGPPGTGSSLPERARRFAGRLGEGREQRYLNQVAIFGAEQRRALYTPEFGQAVPAHAADRLLLGLWEQADGAELLDRMLEVDTLSYLPGDLLTKIDVATMAYSLEGRSPLLDHEMVELAAAIPARLKARGSQRKIAFREALRGRVPDTILDGPKQGFEIPVSRWLRDDLAPFAREALLDEGALTRDWLRPDAVAAMFDQHAAGIDHGRRLWSLLTLELWARFAVESHPLATQAAAA